MTGEIDLFWQIKFDESTDKNVTDINLTALTGALHCIFQMKWENVAISNIQGKLGVVWSTLGFAAAILRSLLPTSSKEICMSFHFLEQ